MENSILDRTEAIKDLGYNVPFLCNWGRSCSYVGTAVLVAPMEQHLVSMLDRRVLEKRGEATPKADGLAQALRELLTDNGTKPISVENFRKSLTPDMPDKCVAGSLLTNLRVLFSEDGLKLKAEDAARVHVKIDRAALCPICGKVV